MSENGERSRAAAEDDISIEEGEPEILAPASPPESPPTPPPDTTPRKRDTRRMRGRMTLRIPDDVVSRPSDTSEMAALESSAEDATLMEPARVQEAVPVETASLGPAVATMRIITINPPPPPADTDPRPRSEPPPSAPVAPIAPRTVKDLGDHAREDAFSEGNETLAVTQPNLAPAHETSADESRTGQLPSSPDIVIDEDIPPEPTAPESGEIVDLEDAAPSAPEPATPNRAHTNGGVPRASPSTETMLDPEELGLKSEPPPRHSDPGDPAEVSPEDVVSIESVPARALSKAQAPPPPVASTPKLSGSGTHPTAKALGLVGQAPAAPPHREPISKPPPAPPPPPMPRPPLLLVPGGVSPLAPPPMNEAAATRKRGRPWWEELFNDDFIRTMAKVTDEQIADEVDFIEEALGLAKGAVVLDLACGTGRHAIEMTSRGYQVVGFDLSLAMLARAADEAQERDQKLNFVQGDMREMTFEETFDGIYVWNTSFGFFEEEKNAAVVANLLKALKAGGLLLLDVINRDYLAKQSPSLAWFEGDGCVCMDEMHVDWITSRMRVKRTMMLDDGRTRETDYSVRVYALHELGKVLHDNGFRVTEVSGRISTPGVFFGADSPRILVVAEKR
jgi:SAM-dependent methyltransferase